MKFLTRDIEIIYMDFNNREFKFLDFKVICDVKVFSYEVIIFEL